MSYLIKFGGIVFLTILMMEYIFSLSPNQFYELSSKSPPYFSSAQNQSILDKVDNIDKFEDLQKYKRIYLQPEVKKEYKIVTFHGNKRSIISIKK